MTDDLFCVAPVLTMTDSYEAVKVVQAISRRGFDATVCGKDVIVEWRDVKKADQLIRELRMYDQSVDWSKVEIDWYERTTIR